MLYPIEIIQRAERRLTESGFPPLENYDYLLELLNEAAERVAEETYCVEHRKVYSVTAHKAEHSRTVVAGASTTEFTATDVTETDNDAYNGWLLTNLETGERVRVVDSAYATGTTTFTVTPPFAATPSEDDNFDLDNLEDEQDLPGDFIQEYFVVWGKDHVLTKMKRDDLKIATSQRVSISGFPQQFYFENNKIKLYPMPNETNILTLEYYAYPRVMLVDLFETNSAGAGSVYLPHRYKGAYPADRIIGSTIICTDTSGGEIGESREIVGAVHHASGLLCYVYPDFGGAPSAEERFITTSDLPPFAHSGLHWYMVERVAMQRKGFEKLAQEASLRFAEFVENVRTEVDRKRLPMHPLLKQRNSRELRSTTINMTA